ncbi:MAG: anhydro-N-acetylmuramic acid kinase [Pseudomonadota bacterium]
MTQRFIGVMSGTSVDAIDAVLCDISNTGQVSYQAAHTQIIPVSLKQRLQAAMTPQALPLLEYKQLEADYSALVSDTINQLLQHHQIQPAAIQSIGCHGQTLWHYPPSQAGKHAPFSLQLINAVQITTDTGISVINDFRQKDILVGGEGAPLVPAFHYHSFRQTAGAGKVILNLGGIANITWIGHHQNDVIGFDTGPANTLLDAWYRRHFDANGYDQNGAIAASGTINSDLLQTLLNAPYFDTKPPKSTGRELFNLDWLDAAMTTADSPENVLTTLVELTAVSIARAFRFLPHSPSEVIACGGGIYNATLMTALQRQWPGVPLTTTEHYQLDPQLIEAMAFAWLAWCYDNKKPGNLPAVTGARCPVILGTKVLSG